MGSCGFLFSSSRSRAHSRSPVSLGGATPVPRSSGGEVVASVYDGDTLTLRDGRRVRLLQIDTPELGSGECYSRAARSALVRLVPLGATITLEIDPALDRVDRYGRLLRYVRRAGVNVNLELVREGAAAPYFYRGDRGRYAPELLAAALRREGWEARALEGVSLDGPCPDARGRHGPERPDGEQAGRRRHVRPELRRRLRPAVPARPRLRRHSRSRHRARPRRRERSAPPRRRRRRLGLRMTGYVTPMAPAISREIACWPFPERRVTGPPNGASSLSSTSRPGTSSSPLR